MGVGFVILIHFFVIFLISAVIAIISGVTIYFVSNKDKRKRKIFLAIFIPFQSFYTLYILALVGSIIVSEIKNVDIGIGDSWYAPLNEDCQILFIDLPELAYLQCGVQSIIGDVSHIQQIGERVFGKTVNDEFFVLHLPNNKIEIYSTANELIKKEKILNLDLIEAWNFYQSRKREVLGSVTFIVGIFSFIVTVMIVLIFSRLVLFGWRLGLNKKSTPII